MGLAIAVSMFILKLCVLPLYTYISTMKCKFCSIDHRSLTQISHIFQNFVVTFKGPFMCHIIEPNKITITKFNIIFL